MCKWVQPQMSNCLRTALNCFPGCLPSPQVQCIARRRPQCTATPRQQRWGRSRTTSRSQGQDQCLFSVFFMVTLRGHPQCPKTSRAVLPRYSIWNPSVGEIFFLFPHFKVSQPATLGHGGEHTPRGYTLYLQPPPSAFIFRLCPRHRLTPPFFHTTEEACPHYRGGSGEALSHGSPRPREWQSTRQLYIECTSGNEKRPLAIPATVLHVNCIQA